MIGLGLRVARPWAGVVRGGPHGVTHSRFDGLEKLRSGSGAILTFFWGGVPGFLCTMGLWNGRQHESKRTVHKKDGCNKMGNRFFIVKTKNVKIEKTGYNQFDFMFL
jgi:hypothetical protein